MSFSIVLYKLKLKTNKWQNYIRSQLCLISIIFSLLEFAQVYLLPVQLVKQKLPMERKCVFLFAFVFNTLQVLKR